MSSLIRLVSVSALAALVTSLSAADLPKDSPFAQAAAPSSAAPGDLLEFAGVSSVGEKTMINLYDRNAKHGFWVQEGKTDRGITIVKYDPAHDVVTIRRNGTEKTLPLRPPSAVVNGPVTPSVSAVTGAATAAGTAPLPPPPPVSQLSQARQEEEARMLVSDLLEIGMVQRRAYEEAQKKAAAQQAGGGAQSQPASPVSPQPSQPAGAAAQPAGANPASAAPTSATPSS